MDFDKIGKYLCFILRHHPEKIGITLDEHGWADVNELLAGISERCPLCREQLEEIVLLSEFHLKKDKDKVVQVSDLDGKFHHVLYEASNSRIMEHTLSDFHKYVKMARMLSVGAKNRAEKSIEEHKAILEAIKKGDADEAERLANLHIMHVMENLHIEIED